MPTAEYLLNIDGITTDAAGVPFESYSVGVTTIGSQSTGAGAGRVTFNPFTITRKIDKSSPLLFQACVTGKHIPHVSVELLPAAPSGAAAAVPTTLITLGDVEVTQINEAGNVHGGVTPLEEVTFAFRTFEFLVDGTRFLYDGARGAGR